MPQITALVSGSAAVGGGGADDFEDSDDDDEPSEPVEEVEAPKAPRQSALKARKSSAMSKKKDPLRMAAKSKAVADLEHCTVTRYGWVKRVAAAVCAGGNVPKAAATQHSSDLSRPPHAFKPNGLCRACR